MCTGRVDMGFLLRAFLKGADGVIVGGCWLGECHYVTQGNFDALATMHFCKKLLEHIGLKPERLRIEWIGASEGNRFAEVMSDFVKELKALGPLGQPEGLDDVALKLKLDAVNALVPFFKVVERERLRVTHKSERAYTRLYESDEVAELFDGLIADKLAISHILVLLQGGPLSKDEIASALGMAASALAEHLERASRESLVDCDPDRGSYALADSLDLKRWALSCKELIAYSIDPDKCMACMICMRKCPSGAIVGAKKTIHVIEHENCVACGRCLEVCPPRFDAVRKISGEPIPPHLPEGERLLAKGSRRQGLTQR